MSTAQKLTPSTVQAIRQAYRPYDRKLGRKALAWRYGVSVQAIHNAVTRQTWASVS